MIHAARKYISKFAMASVLAMAVVVSAQSAPLALQDVPLYLLSRADPNVLINMSVETPMGGAAYTDNVGVPAGCAGRRNDVGEDDADDIGTCYFTATTYLGYFDSAKCYTYSGGRFTPSGIANADHSCSGAWSGNFLNWATMTAIDMFVWTMTGGNRVVDTTGETVIRRARKQDNNSWFPRKAVGATINVGTSTVTPYSSDYLYIHQTSFGFRLGTDYDDVIAGSGDEYLGHFDVQVRVCDASVQLEANCVAYGSPTYYKPEGSIQRNAMTKRFAAISYTLDGSEDRDGGVLRSNMKYVGPYLPDGSVNSVAEFGTNGILINNPDGAGGSLNSGVINYINKFSDPGYKSHDPISELFYESIRFFKNLGPTPEYSSDLTDSEYGGFHIVSDWEDPMQYRCQKNFIIAINDANPWLDKQLPGTFFDTETFTGASGTVTLAGADYGQPSNADSDINVTALTNRVGELEGLNNTTWNNSGTWTSGTVTGANDSVGGGVGTFDNSCTAKAVGNLGEVMGTCPYPAKQNSYYVAGLAYYANTTDLRPDHENDRGIQNVKSFVIDTQEYASNPLDGPRNMLWLAGKYGGFNDENEDRVPQPTEWDADGNGMPDNYVLATQPQNLVEGLNRAFDFIDRQLSSASSASINSGSISEQTRIYQTRFNSSDWTGQLLAYPVNEDGSLGDGDDLLGEDSDLAWDASDELPDPAAREIITINSDGSKVAFAWDELDDVRKAQLDLDEDRAEAILDYLRGDGSNEGTAAGRFRARRDAEGPNKLGDIISSAPLYVGAPPFRYRDSFQTPTYQSFASANEDRTPMVYVGANDGMLHGFEAETGEEVFAFIPSPVFSRLKNLALQNYTHQFYVDGSPSMGDVFFGGSWKTVLVGGLNKGGQGIYALNITNPDTLAAAESNPNVILWEFTDANDADLGFTYSQPSIVRLQNGRWAAVFGNGYNSTEADGTPSSTGNAVLYVVDIENGSVIAKLDTMVGNAQRPDGVTWDNGLSTPALVDINGDRVVEYAYAGDLFGNMWKFDLSSTTASEWKVAYGTTAAPLPLFTAKDADDGGNIQPITGRPEITRGPQGRGMMVLFGTGKYLERSDVLDSPERPQTFYGIFDRNSGADTDRVTARGFLTEQTIDQETTFDPSDPDGEEGELPDPDPVSVRVTSNHQMTASGWFIDLVSPSGYEAEKSVTNPIVRNGNVIFTTIIPDTHPCGSGGRSWLMELNALTGARLATPPFDFNNDGFFTDADAIPVENEDGTITYINVSGVASQEGILQSPGVVDGGTSVPLQFKYSPGSTGGIQKVTENPGVGTTGRQSWRQIR